MCICLFVAAELIPARFLFRLDCLLCLTASEKHWSARFDAHFQHGSQLLCDWLDVLNELLLRDVVLNALQHLSAALSKAVHH